MGPWPSIYRNLLHWTIIAIPIGVVAGLGSVAFMYLWQESTNFFLGYIVGIGYPEPGTTVVTWSSSFPRILLLPVVMGLGGLAVGLLSMRFAPEVQGHGTDESIRAFHHKGGKVRLRVAPLKMITAAITLGTGGSGGREGPTAQVGSSFGSAWADLLKLSPKERRISMAVGLGAGISAIFKAPLGGAIYGAEIFYMTDFEPEVIFPSIMASVVSYSIFGLFYTFNPLFTAPLSIVSGTGLPPWTVNQLPLYAILGALCAVVGVGFVVIFRHIQVLFQTSTISRTVLPAVGGLAAGGLVIVLYFLAPWGGSFVALSAINVGYGFVQGIMLGQYLTISSLVPVLIVALGLAVVLRMITTSFTVGSGGSAGLFGTSVVVGALLGSSVGVAFRALVPGLVPTPDIAVFAIVGMMAFFGGISKAPLAVLVMVVEMVASYSILIPAMLSIFIAYAATGKYHIYSEQVDTRMDSEAHREEAIDFALKGIRVTSIMDARALSLDPHLTVAQSLMETAVKEQTVIPVIREGVWYGIVRRADLVKLDAETAATTTIYDLLVVPGAVVSEEASVAEAYQAMLTHSTDVAVIISTGVEMRFRGLLTQERVLGLIERGAPIHD